MPTAPSPAIATPAAPSPAPSMASGWLLAALGAVAFSGKAIIVKLAYRHGVDAVTLIMYRMLFALPFFIAMAWWGGRGKPPLTRRDMLAVMGLGISGYYLASLLDFMGLQYISAGLERLILYLTPTLVMLLGWALRGARLSRSHWLAVLVSYSGALLVFGREMQLPGTADTALGASLVFGGTLSYALYLFFSGEYVQRLEALRLVGLATSFACLCCIAQFLLTRPLSAAQQVATPVLWLSLLNATACTVAPVLMVMMAMERIGASLTAQIGMIGPLSTIAMGVWLLGEPFTPWLAAGTVLVVTGIWLFSRAGRR
ncbi:EamA family transporter [Vandammella animalimorsus]|uniref:EamA family transporter n=1 Tax=Vandammella animalimorsus TaxID=2029117 RepID=A0A2A2T3P6_9BURK|nr:DMT family transporter [Vandammella animalimorsus]PAT31199.1 EamA family transporter [Vandammella animalimorsus]PAX16162.1 EamA family transporter [Vandammella animalimorsus]PAX18192.1 EamA family transporter [Vandammella animalimorsus]